MNKNTKEQAKQFVVECLDNYYNRAHINKQCAEWYRDYNNNKLVKREYQLFFRWKIINIEVKHFYREKYNQEIPLSSATMNKIFDKRFDEIMSQNRVDPEYYRGKKITITS